jgi:hypothetical protein
LGLRGARAGSFIRTRFLWNAKHCHGVGLVYSLRSIPVAEMDDAKLRLNAGLALQSHVICSTCAALENLHHAIASLETLPASAIEALRDVVADRYGKREDAVGEFARAYLKYLETPLAAARILERRARSGISAHDKLMEDYELKPPKEE